MKTNLFIILSLIILCSCNPGDDGGTYSYRAPSGPIAKAWVQNSQGSIQSIDLSNPNNIVVIGMRIKVPIPGTARNGMPPRYNYQYSDCTYSSATQTVLTDMSGTYDMVLLTGDPAVCSQLVPVMGYRHYGFNEIAGEFLLAGGASFK